MNETRIEIDNVGKKVVKCRMKCEGVRCNPKSGIIPRCLYFEDHARRGANGTIVVGINPGKTGKAEGKLYRTTEQNLYEAFKQYFRGERNNAEYQGVGFKSRFYGRIRTLVDSIPRSGPILWTELVKCENKEGTSGLPPLQTFRTCVDKYLKRELKCVPGDWPLIGVGREPFKALSYMFSDRTVIGVPHPTGSYGKQWHGLFLENKSDLKDQFQDLIEEAVKNKTAIWINGGKQ